MSEALLMILIGILAGIFSGLFGIGGGVIIIIALTILGFSQQKAQGISLGALLIPIGIFFGFLEYYRNGNADIKASVFVAFGLAIGAFLGAYLANRLSSPILSKLFGIFLLIIATRMILKN